MRKLGASPLLVLALASCSGSTDTAAGCSGLRTAKQSAAPAVLFGALSKLNERFLCAHFGRPTSIRSVSQRRQVWTYNGTTFTLSEGHVVAYHERGGPSWSTTAAKANARVFGLVAGCTQHCYPIAGHISVARRSGHIVHIVSTHRLVNGHYSFWLAPGRYTLIMRSAGRGPPSDQLVTARAHHGTRQNLVFCSVAAGSRCQRNPHF